jgi:outer membrane protein assembly factor BamE (lipoprotein component of BamABCDE complex)
MRAWYRSLKNKPLLFVIAVQFLLLVVGTVRKPFVVTQTNTEIQTVTKTVTVTKEVPVVRPMKKDAIHLGMSYQELIKALGTPDTVTYDNGTYDHHYIMVAQYGDVKFNFDLYDKKSVSGVNPNTLRMRSWQDLDRLGKPPVETTEDN